MPSLFLNTAFSYINNASTRVKFQSVYSHYLNQLLVDCHLPDFRLTPGDVMLLCETYDDFQDKNQIDDLIYTGINNWQLPLNMLAQRGRLSLFDGLTDYALSILQLNKKFGKYANLNASLTHTISVLAHARTQLMVEKIHTQSLTIFDYDCISGLSGVVPYLLHCKDEECIESAQEIVKALCLFSELSPNDTRLIPNFCILPDHLFQEHEKESYPGGMINLGLSHGITGPLSALSIAAKRGLNIPGVEDAIFRLSNFLMNNYVYDEKWLPYWASGISLNDYLNHLHGNPFNNKRLSWCYGSLSILKVLQQASSVLNNNELHVWAYKKMQDFSKEPLDTYGFISPTICHGFAGALLIYQAAYNNNNLEAYLTALHKFEDKLYNMYAPHSKYGYINIDNVFGKIRTQQDTSFLSGASGILLALLAPYKSITFSFDHLLIP